MSISINKLMDLVGKTASAPAGKGAVKFGTKELPDKRSGTNTLTQDQYYNSVKGSAMPKNVGNILQLGTPDGSNAAPGNKTVQIPVFSRPDGAIDPNRIRELTNPTTALPYRFAGYGLEGPIMFGTPDTTKTSSNSIGLIRKAQMSYQNRQTILAPRSAPPTQTGTAGAPPPSYAEATGDLKPYKQTDSELNETYN
jgi:hypothetical protein